MDKIKLLFALLFITSFGFSQEKPKEKKQINIIYGGNFTKDESKFPGASILFKDSQQVQFEHEGADLWCDTAIFYQKENRLRAVGNILLQQGDSILINSDRIDYYGDIKLAKAWGAVLLKSTDMTLATDTLYFDRKKQEAYYNSFGTVVDSVTTLTSKIGKYYITAEKYQFLNSVYIKNPRYTMVSKHLDYYTKTKKAYMYGPSTITGETYKIYCERGFYNTAIERGYGIKNTRIEYNNRIIEGDSVYFDKKTEFASATNNIIITDTINNGIIRAHYAEVFKAKDSVFATKRAVFISVLEKEQDSLYIHGDTLMITGGKDARILRAFRNAKYYKTDLSGKCDSIHSDQKTGITQFIRNPVMWNGKTQITGDSIHLLYNIKTEELDSLKVLNNAFIISKDSLSVNGYNQAKGINLYGKFIDNKLKFIDLIKNTEVIYYVYGDNLEFFGINKSICSKIEITMADSDIEILELLVDVDGDIFPEIDLPLNSRKLKGFVWRGDEIIKTKDDIFDKDDNTIELVKIYGIDNPIDIMDIDAEREERQKKQ